MLLRKFKIDFLIDPDGQRRSSVRIDHGLTVNGQNRSGTVRNGQERSGSVRNDQERSGTVMDGKKVLSSDKKWSKMVKSGQNRTETVSYSFD